jgi:hypothetical protein
MKVILALALLVAGTSAKSQLAVNDFSCANPLQGITVDCSAINKQGECGKVKNGKYTGNFGCCKWNKAAGTCAERPCSFFNKANCNAAPHCGWKYTTNAEDPSFATGACNERASITAGCDSMFKETCEKYYQYCKWNPNAPGPSDSAIPTKGGCKTLILPTTSNTGIEGNGCADKKTKKACRWWQLKEGNNYCTWSTEAQTCYTTAYANAHCKWEKRTNCQKAVKADICVSENSYVNDWSGGSPSTVNAPCTCKWISKTKKCVKYYELPCFKLTGDDMNTQVRRQCCSTKQKGEIVRGAKVGPNPINQITNAELNNQYGTNKCTDPKLADSRHHNCRWCEDQEESPRCTRVVNCPINTNN